MTKGSSLITGYILFYRSSTIYLLYNRSSSRTRSSYLYGFLDDNVLSYISNRKYVENRPIYLQHKIKLYRQRDKVSNCVSYYTIVYHNNISQIYKKNIRTRSI